MHVCLRHRDRHASVNTSNRREENWIFQVTNSRRLRSTYCIIEANYWQARNIARPLCDSRAACCWCRTCAESRAANEAAASIAAVNLEPVHHCITVRSDRDDKVYRARSLQSARRHLTSSVYVIFLFCRCNALFSAVRKWFVSAISYTVPTGPSVQRSFWLVLLVLAWSSRSCVWSRVGVGRCGTRWRFPLIRG